MEHRVIAEPNPRYDVARAECGLLGLREELVDDPIELEHTNRLDWNEIFRPQFGDIEDIEVKIVFLRGGDALDPKRPSWIGAALNRLFEIFTVEI